MKNSGGGSGGGDSAGAGEWHVDAAAVAMFTKLFTDACAAQGPSVVRLGKAQAGEVLNLSGLPVATLLQIWGLADVDGDDLLDLKEYVICCWLVRRGVQNPPLPLEPFPNPSLDP